MSTTNYQIGDSEYRVLVKILKKLSGTLSSDGGSGGGGSPLTVREVDGSPSVASVTEIRFPNTYLSDLGGGVVAVSFPAPGDATVQASYLVLGAHANLTSERVLTGTANQIILADGGADNALTLSLPQDIHTAATPTFGNLNVTANALIGGSITGNDITVDDANSLRYFFSIADASRPALYSLNELLSVRLGDNSAFTKVLCSGVLFNGTTSSFPLIKNSGAELQFRLADDSAFCRAEGIFIGQMNIYQDVAAPAAPNDPTKPALFYPNGGGTLLQWDVVSQAWV